MKLSANHFDNAVVIELNGEFDALTGSQAASFFKRHLAKQKNLIADFKDVRFLSSAGLRVLLATVKEARPLGGDLRLVNVSENISKVLKISGFVSILKIYTDVDSAIQSYNQ